MKIISYDAEAGGREFESLNRAIRKAKVKVPIAAEFPLEDAGMAHQQIDQGHALGKVILRIQGTVTSRSLPPDY